MLYDTKSYLMGLDNGCRRGEIRHRHRFGQFFAFILGIIIGVIGGFTLYA